MSGLQAAGTDDGGGVGCCCRLDSRAAYKRSGAGLEF
jgi:hypothetical protein